MCNMNIDNENRDNANTDNKILPLLERKNYKSLEITNFFNFNLLSLSM